MKIKEINPINEFFITVFLLILTLNANSQADYTLKDEDVVVENGLITLCSYNFGPNGANGGTNLTIPEKLDGQTVTGIINKSYSNGGGVFEGKQIIAVQLPATIELIGERAFYSNGLTKLSLNGCSKLQTIGNYAFARNQLNQLNLTDCIALQQIKFCAFWTNELSNLDLSQCQSLYSIESSAFDENSIGSFKLPSVKYEGNNVTEWTDGENTYQASVNLITNFTNAYTINIWYTLKDEDVIVTNGTIDTCSYDFVLKKIIIPATLDGQTVTGIADAVDNTGVFENKNIVALQLPNNIESIGKWAFYSNKIDNIDFTNCSNLETLAHGCFQYNNISTLNLSANPSIAIIDNYAFSSNNVTELNLSGCSNLKKIGDRAFAYNDINIINLRSCSTIDTIGISAFYSNKISDLDLSSCVSLKAIGEYAFYSNQITQVNFSNCSKLEIINEQSFRGNAIAQLDLSDCTALISIGTSAFYQNNITDLNLSNCKSLKTIGSWSFYENKIKTFNLAGCSSLEAIYRTSFSYNEIESLDFSDCVKLKSIAAHSFRDNNISKLNISNCKKLESIGFTAFYNNELNSVDISAFEYLISIGTYAFANNNFYNFNLPDKTTFDNKPYSKWLSGNGYSYSSGAKVSNLNVSYFADIDSVYILTDDDVTVSSSGILSDITYNFELKNVVIPNELDGNLITSIGNNAFRQVDLVSIKLPDSLKTIYHEAFWANNLQSIDFSNCTNLEKIEYEAFKYNSIGSINLNDNTSLRFIGKEAFSNNDFSNFKLPTPIHSGFVEWYDNYGSTYNGGQTVYSLTREYTAKFDKYDVTFTVKDEDNNLLEDAIVELQGYDNQLTDSQGKVLFQDVKIADDIEYSISKVGYFTANGTISVVDGVVNRNITLITGFTADNTVACDSIKVNFTPGTRDNYSTYIWDFGDGTTSTQMTPQHNYNQTGTYTVSLIVQGSEGSLDTITIENYINIYLTPSDIEIFPANEFIFSKNNVELSWSPIDDCLGYDVYIWKEEFEKPDSPTFNTNGIRQTRNLHYGQSYNWQVIAHSHCMDVESKIQTFTIIGLPDLVLDSMIIPETAYAGQEIDISWQVHNVGEEATNVPKWHEFLWFSPDAEARIAEDVELGHYQNPSFLESGQYYTQTEKVRIPEGIKGAVYYIFIVVDDWDALFIDWENNESWSHSGYNKMVEENEKNNFIFKTIEIKIPDSPDLIPKNISHTGETFSNTEITFSYEGHNEGKAAITDKTWYDAIYISPDNEFNENATILKTIKMSQELAIDSSYKNQVSVHIPHRIYGEYYFYVKTDYGKVVDEFMDGNIYEYYYETNNLKPSTKPINIILSPTPDLKVESIDCPENLITDKNSIDFTVLNQGIGATVETSWDDAIFLSTDEKIDKDDLKLSSTRHYGAVDKGATYFNRREFTIPFTHVGEYFLLVETDYGDKVFEFESETNNTISKKVNIQLVETPDFVVKEISTDPQYVQAGDKVRINYTIENISDEPLTAQTLTDRIYLDNGGWRPTYLGQNSKIESLAKGQTISRYIDYTVPYTYTGNIKFKVITNYNSGIKERLTENNEKTIIVNIASAPQYDLTISNIDAVSAIPSCEKFDVQWTVVNTGDGKSTDSRWTDKVYLSTENKVNANSKLLASAKRYEALETDENYTFTKTVSIPCGISGKYYICIESNTENKYKETSSSNNSLSRVIQIGEADYSDLAALEPSNENSAYAGQPYKFNFEVKNTGSGKTNVSGWSDAIYLSTDRQISNNDILLKTIYHSDELQANSSYTIDESIEIPNYLAGVYYVIFKTDYKGNVFETDKTNNTVDYPLTLSFTPVIDIAVTNVTAPDEVEPQGTTSISWSLGNAGENDINYTITDGVYWSKDTIWDIQDAMMGYITHKVNIAVGTDTEEVKMTDEIPAMTPGDYHVIVRANQRKSVYESDYENNKKYATNNTSVFIEDLPEGELRTATLNKGDRKYYAFDSPEGETVEIVLNSSNEQSFNELYVGFETIPDKSTYDLIYPSQGSNQRIVIPTTKKGKYYILVVAENTDAEEELNIQANILHFEIRSVTVDEAGNGGVATVKVEGSKFLPTMDLRLERNNDFIAADHMVYKDMSVVTVSFNLTDKEIGSYNVVAESASGEYDKLENGFTVVPAEPEELQTYINAPASVRPERKFTFLINYWNAGNNDLNIEGFKVESAQGAPIAFTFEGLDSAYTELYIPIHEEGNEPGILRPDYIGKKEVYCYSTKPISLVLYAIKKQRK